MFGVGGTKDEVEEYEEEEEDRNIEGASDIWLNPSPIIGAPFIGAPFIGIPAYPTLAPSCRPAAKKPTFSRELKVC